MNGKKSVSNERQVLRVGRITAYATGTLKDCERLLSVRPFALYNTERKKK